MEKDQELYFRALVELFEQPGWKVLMEEMESAIVEARRMGADAPDWGMVQYFKGRRSAFEELATLKATIEQHQAALADEDNVDADL